MEKKNVRASNFSVSEENILINLVKKYKNEVECKKTDTDNNKIKANAWQKIYNEFNSILGDPHRSEKVLKNKYDNIKKRAKQNFADNKKYVTGTGGGPFKDLVITDTESDIHEILGTQLTGLTSKFDSDATAESIIIQIDNNNIHSDNENFDDLQGRTPKKMKTDISQSASSCTEISSNKTDILSFESSKTDWTTYTPAMLKRQLSVPLQKPDNKDISDKASIEKSQSKGISAKLGDWAKSKLKYTDVQEKAFIEKHQVMMKQIKEKHQVEMAMQKEEHQARMKYLEEEHNLKINILEKEYAAI